MMLGLLLARAGVQTLVLEKHKDFLRDFRGDTVHPSTLQVLDDLGLFDKLMSLRHAEVHKVQILTSQGLLDIANLESLPAKHRFIALVPQWDLLTMLAAEAGAYGSFRLLVEAEAQELLWKGNTVSGLRFGWQGTSHEVAAALTIAADGRHSVLRERARLAAVESSPPMDVLWFSLPREAPDTKDIVFRAGGGKMIAFIDRFDYWQVGYVIPKGTADTLLAGGVEGIKAGLSELAPEFAARAQTLRSTDQIKLLTVQSNRLKQWWRPGFLCIGDAAHAMTPVGGVGINLAVQDAVAAANLLWRGLRENRVDNACLEAVQHRRTWPTVATQAVQALAQKLVVRTAFSSNGPIRISPFLRVVLGLPLLKSLPGRFVAIGIRPERPSAALLAAAAS